MGKNAVAIGIGLHDQRRAERAAGAGTIFHHDGLTELSRQMIEHQPRCG